MIIPRFSLRWLGVALGLFLVVGLGSLLWLRMSSQSSLSQPVEARMVIDATHTFRVIVANTPAKQVKGLSGTAHLGDDEGMYFPMETGLPVSFWMKDMLISIDILWIKSGKIVGIEHQVPAPGLKTADGDLPVYRPPIDTIDGVLEIAGGRSQSLGIEVGQSAILELTNVRMVGE